MCETTNVAQVLHKGGPLAWITLMEDMGLESLSRLMSKTRQMFHTSGNQESRVWSTCSPYELSVFLPELLNRHGYEIRTCCRTSPLPGLAIGMSIPPQNCLIVSRTSSFQVRKRVARMIYTTL